MTESPVDVSQRKAGTNSQESETVVRITVAICTLNRADDLRETLHSLAKVSVPSDWIAELVVVDNGSTDHTQQVLSEFNCPWGAKRIFVEKAKGLSNARNRAVKESRGDVLLFTDDDVRFPVDWIEAIASPIVLRKVDAVAGGVALASYLDQPWMTRLHRNMLASTQGIDAKKPERIVGAAMAVSRNALDLVGEFDPNLGAGALGFGEETLMAYKLKARGLRIGTAFESPIEHRPCASRVSRQSFIDSAAKLGKSDAYIACFWKNQRWSFVKLKCAELIYVLRLSRYRALNYLRNSRSQTVDERELRLIRKMHRIRHQSYLQWNAKRNG